jgi:hypothetical protein
MVEPLISKTPSNPQEPNASWCPPLNENLGSYKTPEGFYQWHNSIWTYKVNPANFGPSVFHPDCLLTDPFATLKGPLESSLFFQVLFAVFPDLSGSHYTFAHNDNEMYINWAFRTTNGRADIEVPATDIFCVKSGLINYRLSTYDIGTLAHALIIAYGGSFPDIEVDLEENLWRWHVDQDHAAATLVRVNQVRALHSTELVAK